MKRDLATVSGEMDWLGTLALRFAVSGWYAVRLLHAVRKRRVMQLVLSLSPGGTERLVIEICRRLSGRVESVVCCLDGPGEWAPEVEALGVRVVALHREPGFQPSLARQIAKLIRDHRIDVVHCHHYSPYVYGLMAALLTSAELVFTEHGRLSDAEPSRKRRLVNPVFSLMRGRVYSVSGDLKRHMVAEGFSASRVQVVYNGIEPGPRPSATERHAAREQLGVARGAFVTGTVGRLDPVKNLRLFLDAHARLLQQRPDARAVIVGDGSERSALELAARELGIAGSVVFTGYRPDVRAVLPAFDVYLNCSRYEGVSLTVLEAMAAALPVVATRVGGNPEVVQHQETGCLVPSEPQDVAASLLALAADPVRRRTMGDAGRWRVIRQFSIARMVDDYASAYLGLARMDTTSAPQQQPSAADPMSVSDATRSTV